MDPITSLQNPRIKQIVQLSKARERKETGLTVVEGAREIGLALEAGLAPVAVYCCYSIYAKSDYKDLLKRLPEAICFPISEAVFEKVAYREGSDGLIALFRPGLHNLESLRLSKNPFVIVLEAVEKPGNLGAVLRTADAAKADAVVICDPSTDIYNPNVIRSSVGCIFTVQVAVCTSEACFQWAKKNNLTTYAAELTATSWYHECDFNSPSAIVMGTEADGLTSFWMDQADKRIKIPMRGVIDSLNVSVSTAVLTFEAMRQRGF